MKIICTHTHALPWLGNIIERQQCVWAWAHSVCYLSNYLCMHVEHVCAVCVTYMIDVWQRPTFALWRLLLCWQFRLLRRVKRRNSNNNNNVKNLNKSCGKCCWFFFYDFNQVKWICIIQVQTVPQHFYWLHRGPFFYSKSLSKDTYLCGSKIK